MTTRVKNITDHPICGRSGMIRPGEIAPVDQEYLAWFKSQGWVDVIGQEASATDAAQDENMGDEPAFLG